MDKIELSWRLIAEACDLALAAYVIEPGRPDKAPRVASTVKALDLIAYARKKQAQEEAGK